MSGRKRPVKEANAHRPLSEGEILETINSAFEQNGYEERLGPADIASAYAITTMRADVVGMASTKGDPNVEEILDWLPDYKSGRIIVATFLTTPKDEPGSDPDRAYWVFDLDDRVAYTELEAYRRYVLEFFPEPKRA